MPRPYDEDVVLDNKGTLWVTKDVQKVYRVIVVDDVSNWCLIFYNYPTDDAERHGHWINTGFLTAKCSECDAEVHELEYGNYCPNCGARMAERKEDG